MVLHCHNGNQAFVYAALTLWKNVTYGYKIFIITTKIYKMSQNIPFQCAYDIYNSTYQGVVT